MEKENVLILVKKKTRKDLKVIAARRGLTMIDLLESVVEKELEKEERHDNIADSKNI